MLRGVIDSLWERTMAEESSNLKLATQIAAAYVSNNSIRPSDVPALFGDSYATLVRLSARSAAANAEPAKPTPALPIKKSVGQGYIVCLEDGRKFTSLKRHLHTAYNLTPEQYRAKWGLPNDYPMVAPAYAQARSALARKMGLGQKRRRERA
jgi:predicted transcriptional regulator